MARALGVQALRLAATPSCSAFAAWHGALPLLLAATRRRDGAAAGAAPDAGRAMTNSPLSMAVVFHLGPVPITAPVLVTWGIMAVLDRRILAADAPSVAAPFRRAGGAGNGGRRHRRADPRHDARRPAALHAADRHAVPVHPHRQLVVAGSRHRAADRAYRNRRGAGADRVRRHRLVRHPRARRERLAAPASPNRTC